MIKYCVLCGDDINFHRCTDKANTLLKACKLLLEANELVVRSCTLPTAKEEREGRENTTMASGFELARTTSQEPSVIEAKKMIKEME